MNKSLKVYKASAGSGKTFTLACEYIKLLVSNPLNYRQTLAVTFTNKATEEMKMRILSQLYGIAHGLPKSAAYARKVERELDASEAYVRRQAAIALHLLLHNYSYFRVETIDSFFQRILRNLARELELNTNMNIGLNDYQVEEQAVDQLIDSLSTTDTVLQWLLRYIMETIEDSRSWNVIGPVKQFGRTIFRDFYKQHRHELQQVFADPKFFDRYTSTLRAERARAQKAMSAIAERFFSELEQQHLSIDDLSYGRSGVASLFLKMQDGVFDESIVGKRVADCLENPEKWCKKTHPQHELICQLASSTLMPLLQQAIDERPRQWRLYKSADLTLRHLNQLRLLGSIESKVRELNQDANRFLLSDTQQLLYELIEESDSPFIFEKIGSQLEHIMIDEFQDTSTVQWQNFRKLLNETMSHRDSSNLIVGDVKQSIYRWRSGDWRLLANIKEQFPSADVLTLNVNYRSSARVVAFNNSFFTLAAEAEAVAAYDDVEQQLPAHHTAIDGHVELTLFAEKTPDKAAATLQALTADIKTLMAQGVSAADMAILLRSNHHIPVIAAYLSENLPGVTVVSDEAFRLDASPAVVCIVQALTSLSHPEDDVARAYLCKTYSGEVDGPLPEGFGSHLLLLPLYELCEQLCQLFRLNTLEGQTAYLCAFYDQIASFVSERTSDVDAFLREWNETICQKTIQSPKPDGLRLISIHKSKGLEFPHVFVPFCDWKLEHVDVLWCKPTEAPFSQLPLAAIDYSQKNMAGTIYQADYDEEHQQNTVDNLNLLYVAFTRAASSLFVYGRRGASQSRSALIEAILPNVAEQLEGSTLTGVEDAEADLHFSFGTDSQPQPSTAAEPAAEASNPFLAPSATTMVELATYSNKVTFRQSNKSRQFATPDDGEAPHPTQQEGYIRLGNVLHSVLASIETTADVDRALKQLEQEGVIYDDLITRQKLEKLLRQRLADPRIANWFSGRWQLYNECSILSATSDGRRTQSHRPDRVMTDGHETIVVDFKFGKERTEYHEQVRNYMQLLTTMGLPGVKGFLWLVYSNKIIEVK